MCSYTSRFVAIFFSTWLPQALRITIPECAIYLSEFVEGEVGRELERCRHVFHASCVEKWPLHGEGHGSCPLCQSPAVVPEADVGETWKDERGGRLCFEEDLALILLYGPPKFYAAQLTRYSD